MEDKGNDASMIEKKKRSWKAIRAAMVSAGYDREIGKIKSQWVRMKVSARKAVASVKRASIATGNSVNIPELSVEDSLVQSMIFHEFEEDSILIDSNCVAQDHQANNYQNVEYLDSEKGKNQANSEEEILITKNDTPTNSPQKCPDDGKKYFSPSKLNRLRSLPKTASKNSVLTERQRQIAKESLNSEQICKLQQKQLKDEIEHQQRMHKLQELQLKEIHSLKLQHLQRQIKQDEELHTLKIDLLRGKSMEYVTEQLF